MTGTDTIRTFMESAQDHLYMGGGFSMTTWSLGNPAVPVMEDTYNSTEPSVNQSKAIGDLLYSASQGLFEIFDIGDDPSHPNLIGSVALPNDSNYIAVDEFFTYLGNLFATGSPMIMSTLDPVNPTLVHEFADYHYPVSLTIIVNDGYLYVGTSEGIRIYDLY